MFFFLVELRACSPVTGNWGSQNLDTTQVIIIPEIEVREWSTTIYFFAWTKLKYSM